MQYKIERYVGTQYLFETSRKWYDHEKDMKAFSKGVPNILFKLSGEGEENNDVWVKYFKNGKMYSLRPIITWPDFNESMLK